MLTQLFKLLFSISATATSLFSIDIFGPGLWSLLFLGIALVVALSVFFRILHTTAVYISRISGVLVSVALILLLIAATTGGSFNMSESNEFFGFMLALLAFFGLSAFFWPVEPEPRNARCDKTKIQ